MEKTEYSFSTKVQDELKEDENVLWAGRPEPFPLKNAENKKSLTTRWLVCGLLFVVLTAVYAVYSMGLPAGFKPAVVIVIAFVFGYIMLMPVMDHKKVQKKCQFIVTDKRVLTVVGDSAVYALGRAGLKVNAVPAEQGCVHLLLGAAEDTPAVKYLTRTFVPVKAEGSEDVTGLVFYNVKDSQELRDFFNY